MSRRSRLMLLLLSLGLTSVSTSAGYLMIGSWWAPVVYPILILIWIITRKTSAFWSASSVMVLQVIFSAMGIIAGVSLPLMLLSGTTALIGWELLLSHSKGVEKKAGQDLTPGEIKHLISLGTAGLVGLALAFIGGSFSLQISFILTVVLVLLAFGGLVMGFQLIARSKS